MIVAKLSFHMKSHITKQLLNSISVDIRMYLPEKVIIHRGKLLTNPGLKAHCILDTVACFLSDAVQK